MYFVAFLLSIPGQPVTHYDLPNAHFRSVAACAAFVQRVARLRPDAHGSGTCSNGNPYDAFTVRF
jgi:hypothetical protein